MKRVALLLALVLATVGSVPALAQQKVIRFAHQKNLFMAPVFVAIDKGWFDEALGKVGYKMERREINVGPAVAEAMAADQIDIGQLGVAVIVTAAGRGLPAKIVVNTGVAGEGVVVRPDSGITSMAQLRGKTIAIPAKGNMQDFIVRRGLEKAGLDPAKDVKFIEVAAPDQKQALNSKQVDAITLWEPLVTDAVLGGGRLLATGQEIFPGHDNDSITATVSAIGKHPDAVRAIVQTVVRAQQWVMDNPEEAKTISAKYLGLPRATIDAAWSNVFRRRDGRPSAEYTQQFADFLYKWGYIKTKLSASDLIDGQFLPK
ncbi:MAG TPA: ABC transporter substrate-binding protein [Casimicrobiaceae bacterium]|nr:ABC transporter substrate-binding protein [Casimicrobiaceae bacterium]